MLVPELDETVVPTLLIYSVRYDPDAIRFNVCVVKLTQR